MDATNDPATIAAGLSERQRDVLIFLVNLGGPVRNIGGVQRQVKNAMAKKGLITGGSWWTLTPLGVSVRECLTKEKV